MIEELINYDSVTEITTLLNTFEAAARKRWGQNFLINRHAREKIIDLLDITADDEVWEIGPGLGAMTVYALNRAKLLKVFEIDPVFQTILTTHYQDVAKFSMEKGDVLKTWQNALPTEASIKVIGNLPYNIAAAIIQILLQKPVTKAVITVQKEMGERMLAKPSTKAYSSFSVYCQTRFTLKNELTLRRGSFFPAPNVDSVVLSLIPKDSLSSAESNLLSALSHSAFANRRKTLKNNWQRASSSNGYLAPIGYQQLIEQAQLLGFKETMRAEECTSEMFLALAKTLAPINGRHS